jgi:hypothetical protein
MDADFSRSTSPSGRPWSEIDRELFEAPFNLAGEWIDNSTTAEGEARIRALAEAEARRAQRTFFECGGTFDGFTCGSDADPGL